METMSSRHQRRLFIVLHMSLSTQKWSGNRHASDIRRRLGRRVFPDGGPLPKILYEEFLLGIHWNTSGIPGIHSTALPKSNPKCDNISPMVNTVWNLQGYEMCFFEFVVGGMSDIASGPPLIFSILTGSRALGVRPLTERHMIIHRSVMAALLKPYNGF